MKSAAPRLGLLFSAVVAALPLFAQAPLAVTGGAGSPFTAPAAKVYSIYDYRTISNVTESLHEFIELNESLPGSVKPATLTAETARANLRALLAGEPNRAFLKAVADAPKLQTVDGLNGAAMIFFTRGRSAEALACLLLAAEKTPTAPSALLNLAAGALAVHQANEALALLTKAEQAGELPPGACGLSGAQLGRYLRGYALMLRGEYPAARALLLRVVEAEPNLKEAALTLALVEAKLGENPRQAFLRGVWRQRGKLTVRDVPDPKDETEAKREPDGLNEGEDVAPSMSDLFDLTSGQPGKLPEIARPKTPGELYAMTAPYTESMLACMSAAARQHNDVAGPSLAAFEKSTAPKPYTRRMTALYNRAVLRIGAIPALDAAARESDFLRQQLDRLTEKVVDEARGVQADVIERHREAFAREGHPTAAEIRQQNTELDAPTQRAIEITSRPLQVYHHALAREFTLRSAYMNGMLAHIGASALRTALTAEAESVRNEMQVYQLSAVINLASALATGGDTKAAKPNDGEAGHGPACSDDDSKWSLSVDLEIVGMEISCNSVSFEVEMPVVPPFVGVSAELGFDTSGTMTVFAGPKVSASGVGSAKEGLYITAGKEGVRDFGGKAELKTSQGIGPVSVSHTVGTGSISFVPGPDPGPAPGPLPSFTSTSN